MLDVSDKQGSTGGLEASTPDPTPQNLEPWAGVKGLPLQGQGSNRGPKGLRTPGYTTKGSSFQSKNMYSYRGNTCRKTLIKFPLTLHYLLLSVANPFQHFLVR